MSIETISCDVLVVGAGVIGLAVAARAQSTAGPDKVVVVVESNAQFGQETSSRNSEVVHSGIYYPVDSRKTTWCIEGRRALYDYCERRGVRARRVGKLVVATTADEKAYLEKLAAHAKSLGVPHHWVTKHEAEAREPLIRVEGGIFLPETGIVDSHQLMESFEKEFEAGGGMLAYEHRLREISRVADGWEVAVHSPSGELKITARQVVNAAGLEAAVISNRALATNRYEHRFCRGRYFGIAPKYQHKFKHLVYPVPQKDGLGIHVTVDLEGFVRLGPDTEWREVPVDQVKSLYRCDWESLEEPFTRSVNRYFPTLRQAELTPGQIGIRPKLFVDGKASPDFLVENFDGFIHCLGIESPGLTSSIPIADEVVRRLNL